MPSEKAVVTTAAFLCKKETDRHSIHTNSIIASHFYAGLKRKRTLYLFLQGKTSGPVMIKGLDTKIKSVEVLGNGAKLKQKIVGKISWSAVPGLVYIDVPPTVLDQYITVLKLSLEKLLNRSCI